MINKNYKYIIYGLLLFNMLFVNKSIVKADYDGIQYDIYDVKVVNYLGDQYIYVGGWAYIPDVNQTNASYELVFFDRTSNGVVAKDPRTGKTKIIQETNGYDRQVESTSITCIKYNQPSGYPSCKEVLYATPGTIYKYNGRSYTAGIEGVKKLVGETGNQLYDNIGFSFLIPLDEYECNVIKKKYIMRIGITNNGIYYRSEFIKILKERITSSLIDTFVSSYSNGSVKMQSSNGYAQVEPNSPSNLLQWYTFSGGNHYLFAHNEIFTVLDTKRAASFDVGTVGSEYYYGINYYKTKGYISGGYFSPGERYQDVWIPGAWIVAKTIDDAPTQIMFPCPNFPPDTENIELSCNSNDQTINRTKEEKKKYICKWRIVMHINVQ
jgi:hypothetical protein